MLNAICGPSSCGKSTLINDLRINGYGILFNQYARELMKINNYTIKDFQKDPSICFDFHKDLLEYKFNIEKQYVDYNTTIFTERTFLDIAVYYILYDYEIQRCTSANALIDKILCNKKFINFIIEALNMTLYTYDKIIYLENIPFLENDGVRITNLNIVNKQTIIFNWFFKIFSALKSKLIIISENDRELRLQQIRGFLKFKNAK